MTALRSLTVVSLRALLHLPGYEQATVYRAENLLYNYTEFENTKSRDITYLL